jgi:hypothetical protein
LLCSNNGEKWPFGLDDGFPPKPWRSLATYRRLEALDHALERRWSIGIGDGAHPSAGRAFFKELRRLGYIEEQNLV